MRSTHRTPSPTLFAVSFALAALTARANNIAVSGTTLTGSTGTTVQVQFNLSWENSWRGGGVANWDAAWVFVKYRTSMSGTWQHAKLSNTGHVAAAGSQIDTGLLDPSTAYSSSTNPVMGTFIYRNATGTGSLSLPATQLQWNIGAQGVNFNDIAQIQVFAIEMVYVPQGAFAIGSGGTETNAFELTTINTGIATTPPSGVGSLGGQAGGYPTSYPAPTHPGYHNGFNAFYCMKYELSQQGYVDFLNTRSYTEQAGLTANPPNSAAGTGALITGNTNRNGIDIQTPGSALTPAVYACNLDDDNNYGEDGDGKDLACNFVSVGDLFRYLGWSCLRPITEMEFEKACRGGSPPHPNEFAWGTMDIDTVSYSLVNAGMATEGIAGGYNTLGNAHYGYTSSLVAGPMRVGTFAANFSNTGRRSAGATYYGIMEMSGNLWERVDPYSYASTGHGDGNGIHDTWPAGYNGYRGGNWNGPAALLRVSDRTYVWYISNARTNDIGGRGVRTAP